MPRKSDRSRLSSVQPHGPDLVARTSDDEPADWLAERLRRVALGSVGALLIARAYWPSEANDEAESGVGLSWVFAMLFVAILGVIGPLLSGRLRLRWSWTDLAVMGLFLAVGLSASHAAERRTAINLAWQWGAVGIGYFLLRWLPRARKESVTLAGMLTASAVAVALYGIYQVYEEFPSLHERYLRDPLPMLRAAGVPTEPGNPVRVQFENRLLRSNEPFSTFALANSLAGYIVGPIALAIAVGLGYFGVARDGTEKRGGRWLALAAGLPPLATMLYCLLLTKSRSAYVGLVCSLAVLGWSSRRLVPRRILLGGLGLLVLSTSVIVPLLLRSGRLDKEVLTQSGMSFQYRLEYWKGTWGVLSDGQTWWRGLGPGNFRGPYLKHKLVESSEEIADPHNLFLETWAIAGLPALGFLGASLGLGLVNLLGRSRGLGSGLEEGQSEEESGTGKRRRSTFWLVGMTGLGGWCTVVLLGHLDLFASDNADLFRWLILGLGWGMAVVLGSFAWRGAELTGAAFGAAVVAIVVHLLAAGALGYPALSGMLFGLLALGQNAREDRGCGRVIEVPGGRLAAFGPAVVLTALVGSFVGAISPYWRAESEMYEANRILSRGTLRPEDYREVVDRLARAAKADAYSTRPWLALAELEYQAWLSRGASFEDRVWNRIEPTLAQARSRPRNPGSLEVRRRRADYARRFLEMPGLPEGARRQLRLVRADALFTLAVELNPTSVGLRADAAEAMAEAGQFDRAVRQGEIALEMDARTPHQDKKLSPTARSTLMRHIESWRKQGAAGAEPLEKSADRSAR